MSEDPARYESVVTRRVVIPVGMSITDQDSVVIELDERAGLEYLAVYSPGDNQVWVTLDTWPALFVAIESMLQILRERANPVAQAAVPPDKVAAAIAACWAVTAEDLSEEGGQALTDLAMATGRLANLASAARVGRSQQGDPL